MTKSTLSSGNFEKLRIDVLDPEELKLEPAEKWK